MTILDFYEPLPAWYLYNPYDVYGIGHAARVLVWVNQIGQAMIGPDMYIDIEVARWAATPHDVRRIDDSQDLLHGQRAARRIKECYEHELFSSFSDHQVD